MPTLLRSKCLGPFGSMRWFTPLEWRMPFQASLVASWLLRFYWHTVWGMTNGLGFLSFWSVIFTMSGMATSLDPTANHIQ